jgi:hypothetical protein
LTRRAERISSLFARISSGTVAKQRHCYGYVRYRPHHVAHWTLNTFREMAIIIH